MSSPQPTTERHPEARTMLIRDLVEQYPETMEVLAGYGMDLCCGGAHTVPEAAELHGIDPDQLTLEVTGAIDAVRG